MATTEGIKTVKSLFGTLRQVGYDYEFLTPLDSKHECAICLLALRKPMQTSCGHRFCYKCIISCFNDCIKQCPIDKTTLNENDLFYDHFAEREILNLRVKCPNYNIGCKWQAELKHIEDHINDCMFKPVICPNICSSTVLENELNDHLANHCIHRLTSCPDCTQEYMYSKKTVHHSICPAAKIQCELCQMTVRRRNIISHLDETCLKAEVCCPFVEYGCHFKSIREDMKKHLLSSVSAHVQHLLSAFKRMNTFIQDIHRNTPFSRQASFRSEMSAISIEDSISDHTLENGPELGACAKLDYEIENEARSAQLSILEKKLVSKESKYFSPEDIISDLSQKMVNLDQRLLESMIKERKLCVAVDDLENTMKKLKVENIGRFCNGNFVWKIHDFIHFCQSMKRNGNILHSTPFYSSPFGYRFHLRLNFHADKDGVIFIALYIHTMQGENDDFLEWPITGIFEFSILDCSDSNPKKHISEKMDISVAKEAFHKPKQHKASKGFGFKEFIPLSKIIQPVNACYIKNTCLHIRVTIDV